MLKIINITIIFLVTICFYHANCQNQPLYLYNYPDSIIISGEFQNKADSDQFYYFLPEVLVNKSSHIAEIYLNSGFSSFYFNRNGINILSPSPQAYEKNKNGQINFSLTNLKEPHLLKFAVPKDDFNGFYGQLDCGYLVHGLIPFNSEKDLLNLNYARTDFNNLSIDKADTSSIIRFNSHAFLIYKNSPKLIQNKNITLIYPEEYSASKFDFIFNTIEEAEKIWAENYNLAPSPNFTVILDEKAGTSSPYLLNAALLHPKTPRKDLSFEILLELSMGKILNHNPKINQEDLLQSALMLILQLYHTTDSESLKSDLYFKLIDFQEKLNSDLVSTGKRIEKLDKEMLLLRRLKAIHYISPKDRNDFITDNLNHQLYEINKTKPTQNFLSEEYPGKNYKRYLFKLYKPIKDQIVVAPLLGFNSYDKIMIGGILRWRKFLDADLIPMYSFENNTLNGIYHLKKELVLGSDAPFRSITPFISFRNFSFRDYENLPLILQYNRFSLGADLHFSSERNQFSGYREILQLKYIFIEEENLSFDSSRPPATFSIPFSILRLNYIKKQDRSVNPYQFFAGAEYGNYDTPLGRQQFLKIEGSFEQHSTYKPGKHIFYRFYAGFFPYNTQETSSNVSNILSRGSFSIFNRGFSDYGYDELLLKRGNEGLLSQQIFGGRGDFKIPAASFFNYGQSNKMLFSANFLFDLPFTGKYFPLKPFIDVAYVMDATPIGSMGNEEFYYTGGLALEWGKHIGIYYPFFYSKQIGVILAENGDPNNAFKNYLGRLSFRVDILDLLNLRYSGRP